METFASSAERASEIELSKSIEAVWKTKFIKELYNAVTEIVLILNKERQIIFYNENLVSILGIPETDDIFGQRPGEVMNCVHSCEMEGGCGTSKFCNGCGSLIAILNSQNNKTDVQEWRIARARDGEAIDLLVKTTPLTLGGVNFTIFSVVDISSENRRKVLERIFFHDILNTAGSIRAISELLQDADENEIEMFRSMMKSNSDKLIDEISAQRDLSAAENNELFVRKENLNSKDIVNEIYELYLRHDVAEKKIIKLSDKIDEIIFVSDKTLVRRVLGNMTKNALEASNSGDTVTIGCEKENNNITFWVHNPVFIPEVVQLKLFKRSFSTKGSGRGIGTYSMRLLSEKYLKGKVSFISEPLKGTIFKASYPIILE